MLYNRAFEDKYGPISGIFSVFSCLLTTTILLEFPFDNIFWIASILALGIVTYVINIYVIIKDARDKIMLAIGLTHD